MIPKYLFRSTALAMLVALVPALPAQAATSVGTSGCTNPLLSQPFLVNSDRNDYYLAPGQSPDQFVGTGWTLSGGAKVVSTTLADGTTGAVLDLPSRAVARSPVMCVQSNYPTARLWVRNVKGAEGVDFAVAYEGTSTWTSPRSTGSVASTKGSAWDLQVPMNLQPTNAAGWQPMEIQLTGKGNTSEFQVYDLYIDPRMAH